jgi:hypothetical protein
MCDGDNGCCCEVPAKKKPEECTPEQIKDCHGDAKEHPCETPGTTG